MFRTKSLHSLLLVGASLFGASLVGCGGGGSGYSNSLTGPGRMVVTLSWNGPTSGKSAQKTGRDAHLGGIPAAANTVTILVQTSTSQKVQALTLTRPTDGTTTTTTTIANLPLRLLNIDVKSYASAATGTVLSESSYQEVITSGKTMQLAIDSTSNLAHLAVTPGIKSLALGQAVAIKPVASDPHGNIITANASGLTWTSSDASIVSVDWANGTATLTGHKAGTATITVTDADSGTSYSFPVTVMTLSVPSGSVTMTTNATQTFTATATPASASGVTWTVAETGGGTITQDGAYTAPATPGVYHLIAISTFDATRTATIAVTVTASDSPANPPATSVTITLPTDPVQLAVGGAHTFAAAVTGTTQTGVVWSVVEANGGSVTQDGVYTAPTTPGVYHIMVVSVADPTKSATMAITVTPPPPGGLNLDIH